MDELSRSLQAIIDAKTAELQREHTREMRRLKIQHIQEMCNALKITQEVQVAGEEDIQQAREVRLRLEADLASLERQVAEIPILKRQIQQWKSRYEGALGKKAAVGKKYGVSVFRCTSQLNIHVSS